MKYGEHLITIDENAGSGLTLHPFINAGGLASGTEVHPEQFVDSRDTGAVDYAPSVYSVAGIYSKIAAGMRGRWIDGKTPSHTMYSSLVQDVTLSGWCPDGRLFLLSSVFRTMVLQKWPWVDGVGIDHSYELTVPHGLAYSNYPDTTGQPQVAWEDNDTFYLAHYAYDAATHRNGIYVQKYHDGALVWSRLLHDYVEYSGLPAGQDIVTLDIRVRLERNIGTYFGTRVTFSAGGTLDEWPGVLGARDRFQFDYHADQIRIEVYEYDGNLVEDYVLAEDWSSKVLRPASRTYMAYRNSITAWLPNTYQAATASNRIIGGTKKSIFVCTTTGTSGAAEPSWNETINAVTNDGSAKWTCIGRSVYAFRARLEDSTATYVGAWSYLMPSESSDMYPQPWNPTWGSLGTLQEYTLYEGYTSWYNPTTFTATISPHIFVCAPWSGCLVLYGKGNHATEHCAMYGTTGTLLADAEIIPASGSLYIQTIHDWRIVDGVLQMVFSDAYALDTDAEYVWATFDGTNWSDPWNGVDYGNGYDMFWPAYQGFTGWEIIRQAFFIGDDVYCGIKETATDVQRVVKIVNPFKQLNTIVTVQIDVNSHPLDSWQSASNHAGFFYDYLLEPYDWTKCGIAYYGPKAQSNAVWYQEG